MSQYSCDHVYRLDDNTLGALEVGLLIDDVEQQQCSSM